MNRKLKDEDMDILFRGILKPITLFIQTKRVLSQGETHTSN